MKQSVTRQKKISISAHKTVLDLLRGKDNRDLRDLESACKRRLIFKPVTGMDVETFKIEPVFERARSENDRQKNGRNENNPRQNNRNRRPEADTGEALPAADQVMEKEEDPNQNADESPANEANWSGEE
jgi:hypothetical protein